jgi:hypothetical protein
LRTFRRSINRKEKDSTHPLSLLLTAGMVLEATQQTKRASHDEFQTSLARVFGLEDCPTYLIGGWQREIVVRW